MRNTKLKSNLIISVFCVLLGCVNVAYGQDNASEPIRILIGQSQVIEADWPTSRVAVTDPDVANVQVLTPERILLQGTKLGRTDMILWNDDETQVVQRPVQVVLDVNAYQDRMSQYFPGASLEVSESDHLLVVRGLLRNADQVERLYNYLERVDIDYVNMTSVAGIQQVQLEVQVAEVSRNALKVFGVNALSGGNDAFFGLRTGSSTGGALVPSISAGPAEGTPVTDVDFTFNNDVGAGPLVTVFAGFPRADLQVFMQALAENQYLRVLANPTLVALSGEEASFLAGGEFPIPVVQGSSAGAATSITIEYKEFGVRLGFRPTVLGDGTIRLETEPEVSNLTSVGAVTIEGFQIPALRTRRARTTIELNSGQTFAMAGLIQLDVNATTSRIPGIGDLPVIGQLFRSVRYAKGETELLILVTASLVEPQSIAEQPPLPGFLHTDPNDWEFYLGGRIQGDLPEKISKTDAQWFKEMGLDELTGPGAWDSYRQSAGRKRNEISTRRTRNGL